MGGMGAVYQAWDDSLGVAVALKVVRPEITADPDAARDLERRFKRELLLARQVTHKNVVRIHDLGEIDGIKYLTMPYIQGSDLASVLSREGRLPVPRALAIMRQVVAGLQAAHEAGVVHRDLKPANIMIDADDQAVIMDFGIARSVSGGNATMAGAVVGTLEYMAPEQAMAHPVDHRADIYAAGLILYDMVLGPRQASRAESAVAELMTRVQKPLPPARSLDPTIPDALERIMDRCTQPDPSGRYQTTGQLASDLALIDAGGRQSSSTGALSAPAVTRPPEPVAKPAAAPRVVPLKAVAAAAIMLSIGVAAWMLWGRFGGGDAPSATGEPAVSAYAVLPFRNMTGDPALDSLGPVVGSMVRDAVGESAHLRSVSPERVLGLLRDLRVGSTAEIDAATIRRVSENTNAESVVTGHFSRIGDQLRIEATVTPARGGEPLVLTESAAGENDLLRASEKLASAIRDRIAPANGGGDGPIAAFRPSSQSVQALRLYGEGLERARVGEHLEAVKRFEEATKADSKFALAYAQLGQTLANLRRTTEAEAAAGQALTLSAALPLEEREMINGIHARITNDLDTAIASYERLVQARPMSVQLRFELAGLLDSNGELERARDEYGRVLEADPKFPDALFAAGRNAIRRRDYERSLQWLAPAEILAVQLDNKEAQARVLHALGVSYKNLGRLDDALRKYQDSLDIKRKIGDTGGIAQSLNELAQIHDLQGRSPEAVASYKDAIGVYRSIGNKRGEALSLNNLGAFLLDRGRYDEALAAFKEALPIQRELGNDEGQALCLYNIGSTSAAKGDYLEASTYLERALELREKSKVPGLMAEVLASLGEVSTLLGEHERAVQHFLRAIQLARDAGDKRSEALSSIGMGNLRAVQGRYGAAIEAEAAALALLREIGERSYVLVQALNGHGAALSAGGRFDEAARHLAEAMKVATDLKNESLRAQTLNLLGDNAYYRGDTRAAREMYEQARLAAQRGSIRYEALRAQLNLAKIGGEGQAATLRKLLGEADGLGLKYVSAEISLYLGVALAKSPSQARRELESALSRSERLDARVLVARAHHHLTGIPGGSTADHQARAKVILEEIRAELKSDAVFAREDLRPAARAAGLVK